MRSPSRFLLAGLLVAVAIGVAACGARNKDAPEPPRKAQEIQQCGTFEELMPRFHAALETGQTDGLRSVIQDHLSVGERPGEPPAISDVLRAIFGTLAKFAALPPELGAPPGEICAETPPPIHTSHPMCEMRRAMDTLVHEGRGLQALSLVDPLLTALLDYVIGNPPSSPDRTAHFEVAGVISAVCTQNGNCQMSDTLDLLIGFTAFLETPQGTEMIHRLDALMKNPALEPFFSDDGQQYGGEKGVIALVDILRVTVLGMDDPSDLDALPLDALPEELRPVAEALMGDLKAMLDPQREPNILRPMKKVFNCLEKADPNRELVRMIYRLGFETDVPAFRLDAVMGAVRGLRDTDERGTLVHLVNTLAQAVRADEQAIDSAAKVCQTLFSTRLEPGESRSNAEQALPVLANLFRDGVSGEAICAVDTLIYGCAGGVQPACSAAE